MIYKTQTGSIYLYEGTSLNVISTQTDCATYILETLTMKPGIRLVEDEELKSV